MTTINHLPISDARSRLPEIVENVDKYSERVIITVNGKPKATLVSFEELEALEETAKIMTIPNIAEDIKKSKEQIKKGNYISLSELK
jgi:antitoxin YefM